jgi:hypothetical protein
MRRISVRSLMAIVLISAIGLAALRNASNLWAGIILLLDLAALAGAVLGAAIMRGREQAWWLGFVVFGAGYLIAASSSLGTELPTTHILNYVHSQVIASPMNDVAFGQLISLRQSLFLLKQKIRHEREVSRMETGSDNAVVDSLLASRALLDRKIVSLESRLSRGSVHAVSASTDDTGAIDEFSGLSVNRWRAMLPGAADLDAFLATGQRIFALLAGLVGGTVGMWFFVRRQRYEVGIG